MTEPDIQRLAGLIKKRRLYLNLSQARAASAVGMSRDTWVRVESGLPVRPMNYDKIEDVLQWATGSCRKILDGGGPVEAGSDREVEFATVPPEVMEEQARRAITNAMVAGTDLTEDRIRRINDAAIRAMREAGILPQVDQD